ncbi:MAG: hypothetical protein LBV04_00280 [Deferribacteraceae bacterium]|nr:hypothetical protein [Deferribacteraceae bacterium]
MRALLYIIKPTNKCLSWLGRAFLLGLCFVLMTVDAKSQFLQDSEIHVDLTGYGEYRNSNWEYNQALGNSWGDRDLRAILGSFGVRFTSGYAGFLGADLSTYTNIGAAVGMTEVLKHDFDNNKERNVADLNVIALKTRFVGAGMQFDFKIGYVPIDVGNIGYGDTLHEHSYRGFEAKLLFNEEIELSYAAADRFSPEFSDGMDDMMFGSVHEDFIHTVGVKRIFQDGYVDAGVGHGADYRINAQVALLYPMPVSAGVVELTGFAHLGRYLGSTGYSGISNEYYIGAGLTFTYADFVRLRFGHSYTSARNSGEMNFRLTPWGQSDERAFLQTAGRLDYFAWDDEIATQVGATLLFDRMDFPGLEFGVTVIRGWNEAYELDTHLQYKFPEGSTLAGVTAGVYQSRLRFNNGMKNEDAIKVALGYSFQFR